MLEDPLFWVFVLPGLLLGLYAQSERGGRSCDDSVQSLVPSRRVCRRQVPRPVRPLVLPCRATGLTLERAAADRSLAAQHLPYESGCINKDGQSPRSIIAGIVVAGLEKLHCRRP